MTDKELKDLVASLASGTKELKESQKTTDKQLKDADDRLTKKLDKLAKIIGGIGNNQGDVAEEYFINSLKNRLKIADIEFDYLISGYTIQKKRGIVDEYDILLINGESVAIIEVKYKVHPKDVEKLPQKVKNLKSLPQYKNYKVYAGVAGFYISKDAKKKALNDGYFVLQREGDVVETTTKELKVA